MATAQKEKTAEEVKLEAKVKELQEANTSLRERIASLEELDETITYELKPINVELDKNGQILNESTVSRYDGLNDSPPVCIFHEALSLKEDNGYDLSRLSAWARGSVARAFGQNADGSNVDDSTNPCFNRLNDLQHKDERGNIVKMPPIGLPPFDKRLKLEVTVSLLPVGS